jgi:HIRAN domain
VGLHDRLIGSRRSRTTPDSPEPRPSQTSSDPPAARMVSASGDVALLDGDRLVQVVGESHYQDALAQICEGKTELGHHRPVTAVLHPEPENEYDRNAVAILVAGVKVGYLAREDASALHTQLVQIAHEHGCPAACRGEIVGGWRRSGGDEGHFGIRLFFNRSPLHIAGAK